MKRVRLVQAAVIAGLTVVPVASASQGGLHTATGFNGTRANLTGSASVPSTGGVIATVRAQSGGGGLGLFQTGEISEGGSYGSDCGTGSIGVMVEFANTGGGLLCNVYFGAFGSNHRFAVIGSSNTWKAYEDGSVIETEPLDWTTGNVYAVGEYGGSAPSLYSFTWGPSGGTAWQSTTNSGSSYSTITSASSFNDGGWSIGSAPSPFTISR